MLGGHDPVSLARLRRQSADAVRTTAGGALFGTFSLCGRIGCPDGRGGMITHRTVMANGIHMHVAEDLQGPLIVLLHGWSELW